MRGDSCFHQAAPGELPWFPPWPRLVTPTPALQAFCLLHASRQQRCACSAYNTSGMTVMRCTATE